VLPEMGARVSFLAADAGNTEVPTGNPAIAVPANVIASAAVSPR
jgi:hypothetical protein